MSPMVQFDFQKPKMKSILLPLASFSAGVVPRVQLMYGVNLGLPTRMGSNKHGFELPCYYYIIINYQRPRLKRVLSATPPTASSYCKFYL